MLGLPKQGQPPADHWLRWVCNKPVGDFDLVLDKGQEQTIPLSALGKNFLQERKSLFDFRRKAYYEKRWP